MKTQIITLALVLGIFDDQYNQFVQAMTVTDLMNEFNYLRKAGI